MVQESTTQRETEESSISTIDMKFKWILFYFSTNLLFNLIKVQINNLFSPHSHSIDQKKTIKCLHLWRDPASLFFKDHQSNFSIRILQR